MKKRKIIKPASGAGFRDRERKDGAGGCFESSPGHSETRSQGGFQHLKENPDKIPDKKPDKNFVRQIVQDVMKKDILPPYKRAKIYNGEKEWFVYYHYYSLSKKKYVREKVRISQWKLEPEQRLPLLQQVCEQLNSVIRTRNARGIYHEEVVEQSNGIKASDTLLEAAEHFRNDVDISESSRKNIGYFLHSYKNFVKANQPYSSLSVQDIDSIFIKHFKSFLQSDGKAGKTINSYLWAIQLITEKLVQLGRLEKSFDATLFRVKQIKNETGKFRPLTHNEKTAVFDYFRKKNPHFYLYLLCIYYTCIRPGELRKIKILFIDFQRRIIKTPWEITKNGLSDHVQIFEPLLEALKDLKIDQEDKKKFLFGRLFQPNLEQYKGKWASDIWRLGCKKLGLPDDANMYGLKHTFNVDYVENNKYQIDWEFLRRHNRHATVQQTQDYISGLTAYFIDETKNIILNYHKSAE